MTAYAGMAPRLGLSSWLGMPQYREAMGLTNENAWSPQEVSMELIWRLDAGLPPPLMNHPIFDLAGRHIGTPDLFEVESGLLGAYDGSLHLEGGQRRADREREETYRAVGLECFVMMAGDSSDRDAMARRMLNARARARWLPPDQRLWTTTPPDWWIPTTTVARRRALTADQQARLLRYRAA